MMILFLLGLELGSSVIAEDTSPPPPEPPSEVPIPIENIPIIAKTHQVNVVRRSRSGRVYLFGYEDKEGIPAGKIILLRQGDEPIQALRILRTYPGKHQVAGLKVREYGSHAKLESGQSFLAIEKLRDAPPPELKPEDKRDLKEIETAPPVIDTPPSPAPVFSPTPVPSPSEPVPPAALPSEAAPLAPEPSPSLPPEPPPLPSPSPSVAATPTPSPSTVAALVPEPTASDVPNPAPSSEEHAAADAPPPEPTETGPTEAPPAEQKTAEKQAEQQEDRGLQESQESIIAPEPAQRFEKHKQWFSVRFGYFLNAISATSGQTSYFAGGGIKYGYNIAEMVFLNSRKAQDSLTAEVGIDYYKFQGSQPNLSDSYSVYPLSLTGRYNVYFSEEIAVFGYLGMEYNRAIAGANAISDVAKGLNSIIGAFGVGMLFRIGPQWFARADLGYDALGAGLVVRF